MALFSLSHTHTHSSSPSHGQFIIISQRRETSLARRDFFDKLMDTAGRVMYEGGGEGGWLNVLGGLSLNLVGHSLGG